MEQTQHPFSDRMLRDMSSAVLVLDGKASIVYVNGPARMLEVKAGCREEKARFPRLSDSTYNDSVNEAILARPEGILYEKQQYIFGVWIMHWVSGVSATLLRLIDH